MTKLFRFVLLTLLLLALSGCSDGGHHGRSSPVFVADILSDQPADGDIAFDPVLASYTITNGPETLYFGIDDLDPHLPEYRAFLDFPLDGATGEDVVPIDAVILSATLEIFIDEVSFAAVIPALMDLVTYPVSGLRLVDYDSPPLLTQELDFFPADEGNYVAIDVTPLMREAQRLGLAEFQVRLLLDFVSDFGFVGIEDRANITLTAPRLTVRYTF